MTSTTYSWKEPRCIGDIVPKPLACDLPCKPRTWFTPPAYPGCCCWSDEGCEPRPRVIAFDLDSTLVETASNSAFAKNASDWKWFCPEVPAVLQRLHREGFKLVIMSNQLGITKGNTTHAEVQGRMEQVVRAAGVPMQCFYATHNDFCRKPRPGMWIVLAALFNGGVPIDVAHSLYVGDAAGRPKTKARKKDFSRGDLVFAQNVGLGFQVPEHTFLGEPVDSSVWDVPGMHPLLEAEAVHRDAGIKPFEAKAPSAQELVVLVGPPAAGKSTLSKAMEPWYARVNQDVLGTKKKCLDAARAHLAAGRSVVVDATNKDVATRSDWVALARECRVPCRALVLAVTKDQCFHQLAFRVSNPASEDPRSVPDMIIHGFFKNSVAPTAREGFSQVDTVSCVPDACASPLEAFLMACHLE